MKYMEPEVYKDIARKLAETKRERSKYINEFIRPIKEKEGEGVIGGFMEVFKYAVKFSSMNSIDVIDCWRLLQGQRMLSSFGLFYGVQVPEGLADEQLSGEYIEMLYRYHYSEQSYQRYPSRNEGETLKNDPRDLRLSKKSKKSVEKVLENFL